MNTRIAELRLFSDAACRRIPIVVLFLALGTVEPLHSQVRLPSTRVLRPIRKLPLPCDNVTIQSASIVRNNKPVANYYSAPTYDDEPSLNAGIWTVTVPAEAFDLPTPYLARFIFTSSGGPHDGLVFWLEAYHPALTVLTAEQANELHYTPGTNNSGPCFIKVSTPAGRQVGSMRGHSLTSHEVTDDWPGDVGRNGEYALQLWHFSTAGMLTKNGDYRIKLATCSTPSASNRFRCP